MIPSKDYYLYSTTASLDCIYNAVKLLLCPVCKQNTLSLVPCQSSTSSPNINMSTDIVTLNCHICNAPVSSFSCTLHKDSHIEDKSQLHNLPDDVTIKEEPQDYPDYDAMDIPASPCIQEELEEHNDLGIVIDNITSGNIQENNFDASIIPESFPEVSAVSNPPVQPYIAPQRNGIYTSSQLKLIKSDKDCIKAVEFVIHDLVNLDDSMEDLDPALSLNLKKEHPASANTVPNGEVKDDSKKLTSITLMRRKRYSCPNCKFKTLTKSDFISHTKICKDPELYCPDCDYTTFDKFLLQHHITSEHLRQFHCVYCPLKADKQCHIDEHIIKHHGTIPTFTCAKCNFSCLNEEDMNSHTIDHELETPYPCRVCPRAFSSENALGNHYRKYHTSVKFKKSEYVNGISNLKKVQAHKSKKRKNGHISTNFSKYYCKYCDYVANKKCNLTRHVKTFHTRSSL